MPSVFKSCQKYTPILWDNKYKYGYPDNILGEKVRNWVPTFLTILHKLLLWWDDEITVLNFGWYSIVFKRGERWEIWQWVGYIWQQLALVPKRFVLPRVPAPFFSPCCWLPERISPSNHVLFVWGLGDLSYFLSSVLYYVKIHNEKCKK